MLLHIDGHEIQARPCESLVDILRRADLDQKEFTQRPIAAKVAGEIFNLNYIPVRITEADPDRPSVRRAMQASGGYVHLLTYSDPAGRDVYDRTAQFVIFLALWQLWPEARANMNCTVGNALYVEVCGAESFNADLVKERVAHIVRQDLPLLRKTISTADAITAFSAIGHDDKARLLSWREKSTFDVYTSGDFADYYYGELAPSTGYLQVWDIIPADGGFMFLYPDHTNPDTPATYEDMPKFLSVCKEGEHWCELMECRTVADLNELVQNGQIRQLIQVNEALHEKRYSQIADAVCQRGAKAVMLAGPSSSGKTTSANRLATQLRVHGKKPILMSLDDYYIDRDLIPPGPDGKLDLEHINTIDIELFRRHLRELLSGQTVSLPSFDFKSGKRQWKGHQLHLSDDSVIIVEGLHALNPAMLPQDMDKDLIFRLYVSPLLPLNLDDHNRIPTSLLRLLRRTVRDYETRGSSVQKTMEMWDSVRKGEKRWIFPYQEQADVIFNSSTLYELAVLKRHIYPLLLEVQPEDACYEQVRGLVKILNYVLEANVDDEIPPTSLVREFIGGNTFYRVC